MFHLCSLKIESYPRSMAARRYELSRTKRGATLVLALACCLVSTESARPRDVVLTRGRDTILPDTRDRELIGWGGEQPRPKVAATTRSYATKTQREMRLEFVSWTNPHVYALQSFIVSVMHATLFWNAWVTRLRLC